MREFASKVGGLINNIKMSNNTNITPFAYKDTLNVKPNNFLITSNYVKNSNVKNDLNVKLDSLNSELFKYDPLVVNLVKDKDLVNDSVYKIKNVSSNKNENKHKSPSNKEWTNSVYTYNKNYTKPLTAALAVVNKLLHGYFNLSVLINGKKPKIKDILLKKNWDSEVYVSKAEVKHTADKINLTVYVYDRMWGPIHNEIEQLGYIEEENNKTFKFNGKIDNIKDLKIKNISDENIETLNTSYTYTPSLLGSNAKSQPKRIEMRDKSFLSLFVQKSLLFIEKIRKLEKDITKNISEEKNSLLSNVSFKESPNLKKHELNLLENYIKSLYDKEILCIYKFKDLLLKKRLYENWFLLGLKKTLNNLYNKKVELNIVKQKNIYLNSDLFVKAISHKLRDRNRRASLVVSRYIDKVELLDFDLDYTKESFESGNKEITSYLKKDILDSIKYKYVHGVKVQAAGRLTKRLTAARALFEKKTKGSLQNWDERYYGKSSSTLKGHTKQNLQYTVVNSKTRNGAFGIKGWISNN